MSRWAIDLRNARALLRAPAEPGLAIALVLGCTTPAPPPPAAPAAPPPLLTIRADALGPLTAESRATLVALRTALRGYDVVPINADGLEFRVSLAGTKVFDVVSDDHGGILNVHVVTPRIDIAGRPWRVGAPFAAVEHVTTCECWADQIVCFKEGEQVAVGLAKICREGAFETANARAALAGVPIAVAIWSARPLVAGGYELPDRDDDDDEP